MFVRVFHNFTFLEYQEAHLGFGSFWLTEYTCKISASYVDGKVFANCTEICAKTQFTEISTPDELFLFEHYCIIMDTIVFVLKRAFKWVPMSYTFFQYLSFRMCRYLVILTHFKQLSTFGNEPCLSLFYTLFLLMCYHPVLMSTKYQKKIEFRRFLSQYLTDHRHSFCKLHE